MKDNVTHLPFGKRCLTIKLDASLAMQVLRWLDEQPKGKFIPPEKRAKLFHALTFVDKGDE